MSIADILAVGLYLLTIFLGIVFLAVVAGAALYLVTSWFVGTYRYFKDYTDEV